MFGAAFRFQVILSRLSYVRPSVSVCLKRTRTSNESSKVQRWVMSYYSFLQLPNNMYKLLIFHKYPEGITRHNLTSNHIMAEVNNQADRRAYLSFAYVEV